MEQRTPSWKCYLEIPEAMTFTEEEKELITKSVTGLQKFMICEPWITQFRLWADTQEQINEARRALGKVVTHIAEERKQKQNG